MTGGDLLIPPSPAGQFHVVPFDYGAVGSNAGRAALAI
jgi:hypothetical protein